MPDYEALPMGWYTAARSDLIRGVIGAGTTIFSSRGCPFSCSFCSSREIFGNQLRFRTPQRVVDELQYLYDNYKIDCFYILDDTFTVNKKHVEGFCRELEKRRLKLIWGCETRVDLVDEDTFSLMRRSGCVQVDFGIESGSQKVLDILKKGIYVEDIRKAFAITKKVGLRTFANIMINNPGENLEDIKKTEELVKESNPDISTVWITTPYPGTQIYNDFGCCDIPVENYSLLKFGHELEANPLFKTEAFKNIDLIRLRSNLEAKFRKTPPVPIFVFKHLSDIQPARRTEYIKAIFFEYKGFIGNYLFPAYPKRLSVWIRRLFYPLGLILALYFFIYCIISSRKRFHAKSFSLYPLL
jgi:radical SAM superfamily enzyme YgiQ (UPF0313 family)